MSNEIKTRPLTPTEQKYTYAQSMQLEGQTGTIGHLRGDFATTGYGFYTTWFDTRPQWKSDEFKAELDTVINALREDKGLLHNRYDMSAFARHFPESAIKGNYCMEYGFRVDTEKHAFLLRCNPTKGDYNFYCYCYVKEWLDKHKDCDRVIQYLFGRGIDYQLVQECIADGTLYESADYHNAVFIGKDESGIPKYAALRSTIGSTFKQDASGSDKRYSFRLLAKEPTDTVHLFEAAIDLLSYATYLKCEGKDYKSESLLSLSGVYQPKKEMKDSKIPIALTTFLSANSQIKTIVLHLDNDKVGRLCTATLKELLQKDYKIVDDPPPVGKDFNDFLLSYLKIVRPKPKRERSDVR